MSKGNRVGAGMKPRGQVAGEKAPTVAPVAVGQRGSIIQPVLDRQEKVIGGGHLDAEKEQISQPEKTPDVAVSAEIAPVVDIAMDLQKALEASVDTAVDSPAEQTPEPPPGMVQNSEIPTPADDLQDGIRCCFRDYDGDGNCNIHSAPGVFRSSPFQPATSHEEGLQADGSLILPLTIPEAYVEGVKQWAEEAGVTMQEWCDMRFCEYLETWSSPARSR